MSGRYRYREIRAGSTGVTIIVDHEREIVWVAATMAGECRSALGMRYGRIRDDFGKTLPSPKRWRPASWRCGARLEWTDHGRYFHNWWTWLGFIVNEVTMGYISSGSSLRYTRHQLHGPDRKASLLARAVREYLNDLYRNG